MIKHESIETNAGLLIILTLVVISIGGLVEIVPLFFINETVEEGEGVRIFIGSENKLFSLSGSSLVVSPYMNADRKIIGAVGVIGPTRLNYGRIVPIVNYTAQLVGKMIADRS